jgi:hypothetical protein
LSPPFLLENEQSNSYNASIHCLLLLGLLFALNVSRIWLRLCIIGTWLSIVSICPWNSVRIDSNRLSVGIICSWNNVRIDSSLFGRPKEKTTFFIYFFLRPSLDTRVKLTEGYISLSEIKFLPLLTEVLLILNLICRRNQHLTNIGLSLFRYE